MQINDKYDEIFEKLYVEQVTNFYNNIEMSKALGISSKQLKTFIVKEEFSINKILRETFYKLLNNKIWLEQYLNLIEEKNNILYVASVVNYMHPNLKQNPTMFVNTLRDYNDEMIESTDVMAEDLQLDKSEYSDYLKSLARYYGVSLNKLTNFVATTQKENALIFDQIIGKHKALNDKFSTKNEIDLSFLNNIKDLKYKVSSLLYNFPSIAKSSDSFMKSLLTIKDNEVLDFDITPIEDEELKNFIESKRIQTLPKKI